MTSTIYSSDSPPQSNRNVYIITDEYTFRKIENYFGQIKASLISLNVFLLVDLILINNFKFLLNNLINYLCLILSSLELILVWNFIRNKKACLKEKNIQLLTKHIYFSLFVSIYQSISMNYLYIFYCLPYQRSKFEINLYSYIISIAFMLCYSLINIFPILVMMFLLLKTRGLLSDYYKTRRIAPKIIEIKSLENQDSTIEENNSNRLYQSVENPN